MDKRWLQDLKVEHSTSGTTQAGHHHRPNGSVIQTQSMPYARSIRTRSAVAAVTASYGLSLYHPTINLKASWVITKTSFQSSVSSWPTTGPTWPVADTTSRSVFGTLSSCLSRKRNANAQRSQSQWNVPGSFKIYSFKLRSDRALFCISDIDPQFFFVLFLSIVLSFFFKKK